MDTYKKWFDGIQRDEEVPKLVRQTVQDTLQWLPDMPKKQQKNNTWKKLAGIAAVFAVVCGVLAVNPSLAAKLPVIGNIFQQVEKEAVYSGEYTNSKKIIPEKTGGLSAESQGIKLTASEVYCDGFSVYVTMQMECEQTDFSKEGNRICVKAKYGFDQPMTREDSDILIDGKCVDKHTFIGMMKFDKTDVIKKDGTLQIRILTIYRQEESISGLWEFEIPYTVYEEGSREIAVNKKLSSHLTIKNVFISPYQIVVFTKESGGVHSQIALFDQNGNCMAMLRRKKGLHCRRRKRETRQNACPCISFVWTFYKKRG